MDELQYPFEITPPRLGGELRPGDMIAVIPENNPSARCQNCQDLHTMMVYQLQMGGDRVHFIMVGDRVKMLPAQLFSGPCPSCRPGKKVERIAELETSAEVPAWWSK
jgi:hypothetical protein